MLDKKVRRARKSTKSADKANELENLSEYQIEREKQFMEEYRNMEIKFAKA